MHTSKPLTAIDLFAGAGGASEGLRAAGYSVLAAVECDLESAMTYAANHTGLIVDRDICAVEPVAIYEALLHRGELSSPLSLLNACPPCQGYSSRGRRREEDPRNDLVLEVPKWVDIFRPATVVVENVPGLLDDSRIVQLKDNLGQLDYGLREYIADATNFGVPQRRKRLILLAVRGSTAKELPDSLEAA
ncbi:MAG: DNA cytosine methyltransferase, partial [Bacteroidota bacterium]